MPRAGIGSIVDMGAGSGAGGIMAALAAPGAKLTLIDCNPAALRLAAINAAAAGVAATLLPADRLDAFIRPADLIVANPPYMIDAMHRSYRDGGALLGAELALQWAVAGAAKLAPGGTMLLYSGSAVVGGDLVLATALGERLADSGCIVQIDEIDPDVFGEELDQPAYAMVERIAALGITIARPPA
jgi:methylase of polypeptide subunit release factors